MILAVETSTEAFSIAVRNGGASASLDLVHQKTRSQHIVSAVRFLLHSLDLDIGRVRAACAGIGPGSFTGIRIGLTFVNPLRQLYRIPLAGASSLDMLAHGQVRWYTTIIPFVRCRKGEVYTALYREGVRATGYLVLGREEFTGFIEEHEPDCLTGSARTAADILGEAQASTGTLPSGAVFVDAAPRAAVMLGLLEEPGASGMVPGDAYLSPLYLRGI